jgi:hypothetical protein
MPEAPQRRRGSITTRQKTSTNSTGGQDVKLSRTAGSRGSKVLLNREGTVHIEQALEYNRDPEYLRSMLLYKLTLEAQQRLDVHRCSGLEVLLSDRLAGGVVRRFTRWPKRKQREGWCTENLPWDNGAFGTNRPFATSR